MCSIVFGLFVVSDTCFLLRCKCYCVLPMDQDKIMIDRQGTTVNSSCNNIGCYDMPDVTMQIWWSLSTSIYYILLVYNDIRM